MDRKLGEVASTSKVKAYMGDEVFCIVLALSDEEINLSRLWKLELDTESSKNIAKQDANKEKTNNLAEVLQRR